MQDKHNFKQLGTIYESMVTGGRDPQGGYSPEPGSEGFKRNELSVKLPIPSKRGRQPAGPMTTLRYDPVKLEPFLPQLDIYLNPLLDDAGNRLQNDSIEDFLVALGVPEPEGTAGPASLLTTSEIEYLVDMLNKKFGTLFSYDDVELKLIDGGLNDDWGDEDAEDQFDN